MSEIKIFEPSAIAHLLERKRSDETMGEYFNSDGAEAKRDQYLARMAMDERGGVRDVLVATSATIKRLQQLYATCPNFSDAIGIVMRAAYVSKTTKTEMRMPPLLLLGPPGIGKTHFARKLANALATSFVEHSMVGADDTLLSGHSLSWRGARAGIVARTLIEGATASPLIALDELEKIQNVGHASDLLDPLLALLEPENSRAFVDSFLEAPIRADKILWIATANDVSRLKTSLTDRFLILTPAPPTGDERRAIMLNLYDGLIASHLRHFDGELPLEVIDMLSRATPRRMRMLIELAIGFAMIDRRRGLAITDIRAAQRLMESASKPGIGFFASV